MSSKNITTSKLDKRAYRSLVLENQLTVLLASDPTTEMAAAAYGVGAGSYMDSKEIAGVAHFVEHMLFLGTEKYPDENTYNQFIQENGGHNNAYTSSELTNYYFDVNAKALDGALDRFAQFFITPLFTESATTREMEAVNSEHEKNIQIDGWRAKRLLGLNANQTHPISNFSTGSLNTLKKPETRDTLLAFHKRYYSPNVSKLVVLGKDSLDDLEAMVRKHFTAVKNTNATIPTFSSKPFEGEYKKLIKFVPIGADNTVIIHLELPSQATHLLSHPGHYISHLVGHEGPGSILSVLKNLGWASALMSDGQYKNKDFTLFTTSIDLTEEGLKHVNEIVSIFFAYIQLIKAGGVKQDFYDELRVAGQFTFDFLEKSEPSSFVMGTCAHLFQYPVEKVFSGPFLMEKYDPETLHKFLDAMTPDAMQLYVSSQTNEEVATLTEEHYGIKYITEPISEELIQRWKSPTPVEGLALPELNPFLPDNFDIKPADAEHNTIPTIIKETGKVKTWYLKDDVFQQPKAIITANFNMPKSYYTPQNLVKSKIFCNLLLEDLNELSYFALIGGLKYVLTNTPDGIELTCGGYNCKQNTLLQMVLQKMSTLKVDEGSFQMVKQNIQREFINSKKGQAYTAGIYNATLITSNSRWTVDEYLEVISPITAADIQSWIPELLELVYCEMFIHGNVTKEEALAMTAMVHNALPGRNLRLGEIPERRAIQLASGTDYICAAPGPNPDESNGALCNYYQLGMVETPLNGRLNLLNAILYEPAFNQLRTVEQLGYIVATIPKKMLNVLYLIIVVQSHKVAPHELDERTELFLQDFTKVFEEMSDEAFNQQKMSVITLLLEPVKSLRKLAARYWAEIVDNTYQFNRWHEEAEVVATLTKEEMVAFFKRHVLEVATRKKLSVQIYGKNHPVKADQKGEQIELPKVRSWKRRMPLYPLSYDAEDMLSLQ